MCNKRENANEEKRRGVLAFEKEKKKKRNKVALDTGVPVFAERRGIKRLVDSLECRLREKWTTRALSDVTRTTTATGIFGTRKRLKIVIMHFDIQNCRAVRCLSRKKLG